MVCGVLSDEDISCMSNWSKYSISHVTTLHITILQTSNRCPRHSLIPISQYQTRVSLSEDSLRREFPNELTLGHYLEMCITEY